MSQTFHELKPFKYDKSDPNRYYDLLRGIFITKEIKRKRNTKSTIKKCLQMARGDLYGYAKLKRKYPIVNLDTIEKIASETKIKIIVLLKQANVDEATHGYETKNDSSDIMIVTSKSFHERENCSLSKLTLVFNKSFLSPQVPNSLKKKLEKCCFVDALNKLKFFSLNEDEFIEQWGSEKIHFCYDQKFVHLFGFSLGFWKNLGNYNFRKISTSLSNSYGNIIVSDEQARQGYLHYKDEVIVVYDNRYVEHLVCSVTANCSYTTKDTSKLARHEKICACRSRQTADHQTM